MGTTRWSDSDYEGRKRLRRERGEKEFDYSERVATTRPREERCHELLRPFGVTRESCDSEAHPNSTAIGVIFDHTGSMGQIPKELQQELKQLMGLLVRKQYVDDPAVLFGAVGDAFSDDAPLQIGQFESGAEMDDDLQHLYLEGNGGPFGQESYELAMYFMAKHTAIDCLTKRGKKGYLFLIGDEEPYPQVSSRTASKLFGDVVQDMPITEVVAELQKRYRVFYVMPKGSEGSTEGIQSSIIKTWVKLLGQENVIILDDPRAVCGSIALAIGCAEGRVSLSEGKADLVEAGIDAKVAASIGTALVRAAGSNGSAVSLTKPTSVGVALPITAGVGSKTRRL